MPVVELVKLHDGVVTHVWKAKYVGATLTITTNAVGAPPRQVWHHTYPNVVRARSATGTKVGALRRKGWLLREDYRQQTKPAPAKPTASRAQQLAAPPWLARVPAAERARIERLIVRAGLAHRRGDLLAVALPSIRLRTKRIARWTGVISRFGGAPDLPPGTRWPKHEGAPLAFIAQLRLDELAPLDLQRLLPARGLLSIFLQASYERGWYLEHGTVLWSPDVKRLVATPAPAGADGGPAAVAAVRAAIELGLPTPETSFVAKLRLTEAEFDAYHDRVWLDATGPGPDHRLLGYSQVGYETRHTARTPFLLKLDTDDVCEAQYGDAQSTRAYIAQAALARHDFRKLAFTAES